MVLDDWSVVPGNYDPPEPLLADENSLSISNRFDSVSGYILLLSKIYLTCKF